jgi:hypothetical protein
LLRSSFKNACSIHDVLRFVKRFSPEISRVQGIVLEKSKDLFSTSVVFFNALTDISYALFDPRIRVG